MQAIRGNHWRQQRFNNLPNHINIKIYIYKYCTSYTFHDVSKNLYRKNKISLLNFVDTVDLGKLHIANRHHRNNESHVSIKNMQGDLRIIHSKRDKFTTLNRISNLGYFACSLLKEFILVPVALQIEPDILCYLLQKYSRSML